MKKLSILLVLSAAAVVCALSFVGSPSIAYNSSAKTWTVVFEVDTVTDVEVSLVNLRDSSILCHLAAGVLGANAPAPLAANLLRQTLTWDGKTDLGKLVTIAPESVSVRVRAGMSVSLANLAGDDMYRFNRLDGMASDTVGNIYVYGVTGTMGQLSIRKYGPGGAYLKTLYPFPAGLTSAEVHDYYVNLWQGAVSRYSPKCIFMRWPRFAPSTISQDYSVNYPAREPATLAADAPGGNLWVVSTNMLGCMPIKTNGGLANPVSPLPLVTSPEASPSTGDCKGPLFVRLAQDSRTAYVSGMFNASSALVFRLSRIIKVDVATGVARVLVDNPSGTFNGTALDDSGHVFACDFSGNRIAVYDTAGTFLAAIPVQNPDQVEVNRATGEIYVLTKNTALSVIKFANYKSGNTTPVATQANIVTANVNAGRVFFALGKSGGKSVVWVGNHEPVGYTVGDNNDVGAGFGIWGFRDDGSQFTLVKDFFANNRGINTGFDRITVDPKTETVFIQDSWNKIFKIENWKNPQVVACSTTTGRLYGTDMTVGPDGRLYVREGESFSGPLNLYTIEHKHRLVRNILANVYSRYGAGYGERGVGVGRDGRIGVMYMETFADYLVSLYDSTGNVLQTNLVNPITQECGGVRFDRDNNVYVGCFLRPTGARMPKYTAADMTYLMYTGSVVKFPPTGGYTDDSVSLAVTLRKAYGALKMYPDGFGPFSGTPGGDGSCTCRTPRFDLDLYGRLFIPNALACRVALTDNNANVITYFGEYGNSDSRGPYSGLSIPAIPLAFPVGVAVSEDFIYICDMYNNRVAQVKMNYVLDNIPGLTDRGISASEDGENAPAVLALESTPNPFNPVSHIAVTLPKSAQVSLAVYNASGSLVKEIVSRKMASGRHSFSWDATGRSGAKVASGVYVYKLVAGDKVLVKRTILAK